MERKKIRNILTDSGWSIAGTVIMTAAAQFLVYPFWERKFGTEKYGVIIYLISLMNIVSITCGSSLSYTRIMLSAKSTTKNFPYLLLLSLLSIISAVYALVVSFFNSTLLSYADIVCYVILCVITTWRYYADVEYRIHLNYKGFFLYYTLIGTGYVGGMLLMSLTDLWALALIPGELLGLLFVVLKGHIFKTDEFKREELAELSKTFAVLIGSNLINTLIFNADRILINHALGSVALSVYYVSSLFGKTLSLITTPLNGVISGYIARFNGVPKKKTKLLVITAAIALALLSALACTIGGHIILPVLYPETFPLAKDRIFICSLTQTIYFSTNIISVIMMRFANKKHQLISNIVYASCFAAICIPMTAFGGTDGFYISFLLTAGSRFIYNSIIVFRIKKE